MSSPYIRQSSLPKDAALQSSSNGHKKRSVSSSEVLSCNHPIIIGSNLRPACHADVTASFPVTRSLNFRKADLTERRRRRVCLVNARTRYQIGTSLPVPAYASLCRKRCYTKKNSNGNETGRRNQITWCSDRPRTLCYLWRSVI
jgi:hypothetical protein